jgi:hypothetical protein
MNVKGFIIEDDQGREFVVVCEKPYTQPGKAFALRGWQRRRMVPLQCTGQELRQITGGVLITLNDLFKSLPRVLDDVDNVPTGTTRAAIPLLRLRKTPLLQTVSEEEEDAAINK